MLGRHHATAAAALLQLLRGRRAVLAHPAAVALCPEREADVVAVRAGAVPIIRPPALAVGGGSASVSARGFHTIGGGGSRGWSGDDCRMTGASDLCGAAALFEPVCFAKRKGEGRGDNEVRSGGELVGGGTRGTK